MAVSPYLQPDDYAAYGVPASATTAQVIQATKLIDSYLKRPEGLLWAPDGNGNPAYMLNATPKVSLVLSASIASSPGLPFTATFTGPTMQLQVGDVLTADVAQEAVTENLTVISVTGQSVQFQGCNFPHAAGAILSAGLVITEQRYLPGDRPMTRTSRMPLVNAVSGAGRYAYGRRSDDAYSQIDTFNLLAVMSTFGGPPAWELWIPRAEQVDTSSGTLWVPAGVMLAYYTEIRYHYVSGWQYATLPDDIKVACGQIVNAIVLTGPLLGNVSAQQAGGTRLQFFTASQLNDDVKSMIDQYRLKAFY